MGAQLADAALEPFSAWSGSRTPRILFLAEAWGRDEERARTPLIGASGRALTWMLRKAWPHVDLSGVISSMLQDFEGYDPTLGFITAPRWGVARDAWGQTHGVAFTNVFNLRPENNALATLCATKAELGADYPLPPLRSEAGARYLRPEHWGHLGRLRDELDVAQPRLVVALGAAALWALTGSSAISSLRGTVTTSGDDAPIYLVGRRASTDSALPVASTVDNVSE